MWLLDSSFGLPNTTENFADATLWHSCLPRYRPLRQPTTRQPNNRIQEFQVEYWLAWLPLFFFNAIYAHDSTQLNVFDINATHLSFGATREIHNWLGQDRIGVKFCREVREVFSNCREHSDEINIDFYWLRGKWMNWWGDYTQLVSSVWILSFVLFVDFQPYVHTRHCSKRHTLRHVNYIR